MSDTGDTGRFWAFTLALYGREGVQGAVLHLQDDRGADVNLLFYALWTASLGLPVLQTGRLAALAGQVEAWRNTAIEPLRAVRTALRGGVVHVPDDEAEALRRKILDLEIESERIEQVILEAGTPEAAGREQADPELPVVAANLRAVMALTKDAPLGGDNLRALRVLAGAAAPRAGAEALDAAMEVRTPLRVMPLSERDAWREA